LLAFNQLSRLSRWRLALDSSSFIVLADTNKLVSSANNLIFNPLRLSSYVASKPPNGGSKTQKGRFRCKIALRFACYKVPLCESCQRQSCKAFIGLSIRAKNDWWERPLLHEILGQSGRVGAKSPIFHLFSLVALQPT